MRVCVFSSQLGEFNLLQSLKKKNWDFGISNLHTLTIPLLEIYKNIHIYAQKCLTMMFAAATFIKENKKPKCLHCYSKINYGKSR